ncbi:MAG: AarF/UbiB family protein [Erysipelotrichaceae bacterium]|nr:AarF/UbiB family protein [Erysipelotrichaceae bacterium]
MLDILKRNDIAHGLTPTKLKNIFEELGPTFIKLGQILSMRYDLLPSNYCDELSLLRSSVTPMPFLQVSQVLCLEYDIANIEEIFQSFDPTPLGSASIAQVHLASLKDGTKVVVKIQRPNIKEVMENDILILRKAISLLKFAPELGDPTDYKIMLAEMWESAKQEMDFLVEAEHLEKFANLNQDINYLHTPKVFKKLTTSHILVMEYIQGIPIDQKEQLLAQGYDIKEIALKLATNYTKQILEDGFFHADPHQGNIIIKDGKIVWLDLGMVGEISPKDKKFLSAAVKAIITNDVYELKNIVLTMGVVRKKVNHSLLYDDLEMMMTKYATADFSTINLGKFIVELNDLTNRHHLGMPEGVSMLGRGLLTIEGVLTDLDPQLNFMTIVTTHLQQEDIDILKEIKNTLFLTYNGLQKAREIPGNIADILKMSKKGQIKIKLELTGLDEPLDKIDNMVNKIILAIICSGLLIGSSLVYTTKTPDNFSGIPAIGALGFFLALILGCVIVLDIIKHSKKS